MLTLHRSLILLPELHVLTRSYCAGGSSVANLLFLVFNSRWREGGGGVTS